MTERVIPPLRPERKEHDPEKPFDGDLFARKDLGDRLTALVERMGEGGVIAIDAPWGEGKTWFGRNWVSKLTSTKHPVALIDAFGQDYVDDPFMMLCSEILPLVSDDGTREKLKVAGRKLAGALIPATAKAGLNFLGRVLLGTSDIADELKNISEDAKELGKDLESATVDALEKALSKRLDEHTDQRRTVEGFASVLKEFASGLDKPLVIVIDELDRCRPDFAVRTIERVKHFFDVPNIVFVLLLNRRQVEAGVRGIYGQDIDATAYLGKFVHFWLRLPKATDGARRNTDHNLVYCRNLAKRYGLSGRNDDAFCVVLGSLASAQGLSLRDLDHAFALYALAQPIGNVAALLAWIVFVKVSDPDLFAGLMNGELAAHNKANDLAVKLESKTGNNYTLTIMKALHNGHASGFKTPFPQDAAQMLSGHGAWSLDRERIIPELCKKIDLTLE